MKEGKSSEEYKKASDEVQRLTAKINALKKERRILARRYDIVWVNDPGVSTNAEYDSPFDVDWKMGDAIRLVRTQAKRAEKNKDNLELATLNQTILGLMEGRRWIREEYKLMYSEDWQLNDE